jgi:geranylgeranyl diphosphate synthase type I
VLGDLLGRSAKRLRPAFVHWGHAAAGGTAEDPRVLDLAVAVELLHTFALVHDDVIDRSPARRGGPSVHAGLAGTAGGDGAGWFGVSAAIVAGDLAFVWADELLDLACDGLTQAAAVRAAYTTLRTEVIAGQYLDLHVALAGTSADHPAPADPLRVALLKSGRYTVTRPLELGARLAGADETLVDALVVFGDAAGVAFQLRDDVLGVFGDEAVTGKDVVGDLREGKRTLLVVRAMELAARADRLELQRLLGDPQLDGEGAGRCRQIIAASGALASVEARIAAEAHTAADALATIGEPARGALGDLLDLLVGRTV